MKYIKSVQNPMVKSLAALKSAQGRKEQQAFLTEGENMVQESLGENKARMLLIEESKIEQFNKYIEFASYHEGSNANPLSPAFEVLAFSKEAFKKFSNAKTPQGIACVCSIPNAVSFKALGNKLILLNGVQDSGNVGTIWRTAEAAGFTGIIADEKSADFFSPKTISASKGACFRLPAKRIPDLHEALNKCSDFLSIAASLDGVPVNKAQLPKDNIMLIIGSEGRGIDEEILNIAKAKVRIPMHGKVESLNAAVAAAIMMYSIAGF